jgi:hypothetical protein
MEGLLKNKKLAVYILTVIIFLQVVFLIWQFVIPNRNSVSANAAADSSVLPLVMFIIFIPSLMLSKKKKMSEKQRVMLTWGLIILATVVLSLMAVVLAKTLEIKF